MLRYLFELPNGLLALNRLYVLGANPQALAPSSTHHQPVNCHLQAPVISAEACVEPRLEPTVEPLRGGQLLVSQLR